VFTVPGGLTSFSIRKKPSIDNDKIQNQIVATGGCPDTTVLVSGTALELCHCQKVG